MPCYDSRDDERQVLVNDVDRERLRKEWFHNSPIAELLCGVMKELSTLGLHHRVLLNNVKLQHWWRDHQARDAVKSRNDSKRRGTSDKL